MSYDVDKLNRLTTERGNLRDGLTMAERFRRYLLPESDPTNIPLPTGGRVIATVSVKVSGENTALQGLLITQDELLAVLERTIAEGHAELLMKDKEIKEEIEA